MAEATAFLPSMLMLILLLFSIVGEARCYGKKEMLSIQEFQLKELKHFTKCHPQKSRKNNGAIIFEMKHWDYCHGQFKNWDEKVETRLAFDESRVKSLQLHIRNAVDSAKIEVENNTQIPLTSGIKLQTLNYIVTVQLGGRKMTVIVDTGSDLTWVQCTPCVFCYDQQDPLFNPSLSRSYQSILCNSSTCQSLQFATGYSGICSTNQPACNYVVNYGDGSYTRGELARDQLNLSSTLVEGFIFGCGRSNKGLFGGASGIMGLGRNQLSLTSQLSPIFGGVFSYCLPSTDADGSGSLMLGSDSSLYKNFTPITYTNLITNPQLSNFYILNLTGISIGGVALEDPAVFGKNGILIDSGTVISRLVPSVYNAMKTEFLKQFSGYPPAPAFSILDTCFNLTDYSEVDIPTLQLKFENDVDVNVDVTGMLYFVKADTSHVCLAITSLSYEDEIQIFGNYQQKNLRIVYDTKQSKLGFAKEICSYT